MPADPEICHLLYAFIIVILLLIFIIGSLLGVSGGELDKEEILREVGEWVPLPGKGKNGP